MKIGRESWGWMGWVIMGRGMGGVAGRVGGRGEMGWVMDRERAWGRRVVDEGERFGKA